MAFGGGFGALDHMNKSLKNNRALLKKIQPFSDQKHYQKHSYASKRTFYKFKKMSPEVRARIRKKMKVQHILRRLRIGFALTISIALTVWLFWWIML